MALLEEYEVNKKDKEDLIDTQAKFRKEFKSHWDTMTSCGDFRASKKDEKFMLLEILADDGYIPENKFKVFYDRIEEGRL